MPLRICSNPYARGTGRECDAGWQYYRLTESSLLSQQLADGPEHPQSSFARQRRPRYGGGRGETEGRYRGERRGALDRHGSPFPMNRSLLAIFCNVVGYSQD